MSGRAALSILAVALARTAWASSPAISQTSRKSLPALSNHDRAASMARALFVPPKPWA